MKGGGISEVNDAVVKARMQVHINSYGDSRPIKIKLANPGKFRLQLDTAPYSSGIGNESYGSLPLQANLNWRRQVVLDGQGNPFHKNLLVNPARFPPIHAPHFPAESFS